jgi:ankyrin repeat protein
LHCAARNGHLEVAQKLLLCDAAVNAIDSLGWTSLHCAVAKNQHEVVRMLLNYSAEKDAKDNVELTPLHRAVIMDCLEAAQVLWNMALTLTSETAVDGRCCILLYLVAI